MPHEKHPSEHRAKEKEKDRDSSEESNSEMYQKFQGEYIDSARSSERKSQRTDFELQDMAITGAHQAEQVYGELKLSEARYGIVNGGQMSGEGANSSSHYANTTDALEGGEGGQYASFSEPFEPGSKREVREALDQSSANQEISPNYSDNVTSNCNACVIGLTSFVSILGHLGLLGGVVATLYFTKVFGLASKRDAETAGGGTNEDKTPPAPPNDLTAVAEGSDSIRLAWNASLGAASYSITQENGEVIEFIPEKNNQTKLSYLITALQPTTEYCFTVTATNQKGSSPASQQVCTTTEAQPAPIPAIPQGIQVEASEKDQLEVQWPAVAGAASYLLKRRLGSELSGGEVIATIESVTDPVTYTDTTLEQATQYCYTVAAQNVSGASADSDFVCGNTLNAFDILVKESLEEWNELSEEDFWRAFILWVETTKPSFDLQLNVTMFLYRLAIKSAPLILQSEEQIQAQVDPLVSQYNTNQDTLELYNAVAVLSVRGQPELGRDEKLNVLSRVIGTILSAE